MTYARIRRFTLELINRHSVAGETVSPDYNQQSDIISRIPNLINAALSQIALALDPFAQGPDTLPENPPDAYELSAPETWLQAACYYAAANLVTEEDAFQYAALMNEFETILSRVSMRRIRAEYAETRAEYGAGGAEWLS